MSEKSELQRKQEAAKRVYDKMMETVLGFDPAGDLSIRDAQFIARMAQTFAFDAIKECTGADQ